MIDSVHHPDERVKRLMAKLTPEARLHMASRMFATARTLILAGRRSADVDRRSLLFDRLYAGDFTERELREIRRHLRIGPVKPARHSAS